VLTHAVLFCLRIDNFAIHERTRTKLFEGTGLNHLGKTDDRSKEFPPARATRVYLKGDVR